VKNNQQPHASGKAQWKGSDWRRAIDLAFAAPRCTARCKHSKTPCKNAAVKGRTVCRMHGGKAGAPTGERNGAYRNGRYTHEAIAERRRLRVERMSVRAIIRAVRDMGY
jgi:hypothetical protein